MRRVLAVLAGAALLATSAACGQAQPGAVVASGEATIPGSPPPVTVSGGTRSVDLQPWTWCYTGGCADGAPPAQPDDLGSPEDLLITFPVPGWAFEASFRPSDQPCGRRQSVPLETTDDGAHVLRPAGPAGTYDIDVFGRGPDGSGDLFATVRWTTPVDGVMPTPTASAAVLAEHDGAVDSYGVELLVDDLAATPEEAAASITVTSSEGRSLTFDAERSTGECGEEGWLFFNGPAEAGRQAVGLGTAPFTYDVALTLDGVEHTASASWPADELDDYAPSVGLVFSPPLPALGDTPTS